MLRMPDAQTVLGLWERAEREHPIDRALSILSVFTCQARSTLARLPIHRLDSLLLASRVLAFGTRLEGVAICPACGCKIDASVDLSPLAPIPTEDGGTIDVGDQAVSFRIPDSRDLAEAVLVADLGSAESILLERCQLTGPASATAAQAIDAEIERLCDAASLELRMACPQCQNEFVASVDIGHFFWEELVSYAGRLIEDVDVLAARYGWAEADILAMPERRRLRYLERLQ